MYKERICRICGETDKSKLVKNKSSYEGLECLCHKCKYEIHVDKDYMRKYSREYQKNRTRNDPEFREKKNAINRKYNASDKGKLTNKNNVLKNTYGITLDEYNNLLEKQNYRCLLCSNCNTALGLLKEDETTILNLLGYIREHNDHRTGKNRNTER